MAQYSVITAPVGGVLSLDILKALLRLDASDTSEDELLNLFMKSAQSTVERYTGLVLQATSFKMSDSVQPLNNVITIAKSPVKSITSVKVFDGSDFVDANFKGVSGYNANIRFCNIGFFLNGRIDFEIVFIAGLNEIPEDLKLAMYQHCAYMFENRGDCPVDQLPKIIRGVYDSYRVLWL